VGGTWVVAGLASMLLFEPNPSYGQVLPRPEFEVASMRSSSPRDLREERPIYGVRKGGPGTADPSRMIFSRVPLDQIIAAAFDLPWARISGPDWMSSERYDIVANVPEGTTGEQARLMLQNLLTERLHLVSHLQTKALSGYGLVVAAGGSKLIKESAAEPNSPVPLPDVADYPADKGGFPIPPPGVRQASRRTTRPYRVLTTFRDTSMPEFALFLGGPLGSGAAPGPASTSGRNVPSQVLDRTGLTGRYDFTFELDGLPFSIQPDDVQRALDKQLGLKLVKVTALLDVVVVDRVEETPTEN
jgi:uncharacterized protein (TIGR03435 family)